MINEMRRETPYEVQRDFTNILNNSILESSQNTKLIF
jgi:hypothetical protein